MEEEGRTKTECRFVWETTVDQEKCVWRRMERQKFGFIWKGWVVDLKREAEVKCKLIWKQQLRSRIVFGKILDLAGSNQEEENETKCEVKYRLNWITNS